MGWRVKFLTHFTTEITRIWKNKQGFVKSISYLFEERNKTDFHENIIGKYKRINPGY
jgi:uncharacterized protein (DUF362 family)